MKKKLQFLFLSAGWILLFLFLGSSYFYAKFSSGTNNAYFTPISWNDHISIFEGALVCSLTSEELMDRKTDLKERIFPKITKKDALPDGFVYYFDDEPELADNILEFIGKEKQCCPFFKFDLSILPFGKGIALKISGSEAVKDFLIAFEEEK